MYYKIKKTKRLGALYLLLDDFKAKSQRPGSIVDTLNKMDKMCKIIRKENKNGCHH